MALRRWTLFAFFAFFAFLVVNISPPQRLRRHVTGEDHFGQRAGWRAKFVTQDVDGEPSLHSLRSLRSLWLTIPCRSAYGSTN